MRLEPATAALSDDRRADVDPFLVVDDLSKAFQRREKKKAPEPVEVLREVSFTAARGETITVIGPSGCGKSTLLNCIAGLASFDSGRLTVDGRAVTKPGPERAVIFQQAFLLPWRTIERNVAYGLELRREKSAAEIAERVVVALETVGLTEAKDLYPHEVSGGMQQRANLARALVVDPQLLLMDEPFGALDALTREAMQDELSELIARTNRTTFFITHDIEEAILLGDTVLVMSANPGQIVERIDVPFERPRPRDIVATSEFEKMAAHIRGHLRGNRSARKS